MNSTDLQKPDHDIEQFWLQFKVSMNNFYTAHKSKIISRNINKWSSTLNELQTQNKYNLIEKHIMDYITCYGIDIIKSGNVYHLQLLNTNIKRWNKISSSYKIFNNPRYKNLFYTCLEIAILLAKSNIEFNDIFEDIELIVINNNISNIINYAFILRKYSIIDKLLSYDKELFYISLYEVKDKTLVDKLDKKHATGKTILKLC